MHKFIKDIPKIYQPKTIFWKPIEVKHPARKVNPSTWEIYTQQPLTIKPGETKTFVLGFGFMMSRGVVLISLSKNLKLKRLSLSNEVILEDVNDVIITITNNSGNLVKIEENEFLCRLYYSIEKKIVVINKWNYQKRFIQTYQKHEIYQMHHH